MGAPKSQTTLPRPYYSTQKPLKIRGCTLKCGAGLRYNNIMENTTDWRQIDRARLLAHINSEADKLWEELTILNPRLIRFTRPEIRLNAKFTNQAGRCYNDLSFIDLGLKFFPKYHVRIMRETLPHEICHAADFALHNTECTPKKSHGKEWQKLMLQLGLIPNQYHDMTL